MQTHFTLNAVDRLITVRKSSTTRMQSALYRSITSSLRLSEGEQGVLNNGKEKDVCAYNEQHPIASQQDTDTCFSI